MGSRGLLRLCVSSLSVLQCFCYVRAGASGWMCKWRIKKQKTRGVEGLAQGHTPHGLLILVWNAGPVIPRRWSFWPTRFKTCLGPECMNMGCCLYVTLTLWVQVLGFSLGSQMDLKTDTEWGWGCMGFKPVLDTSRADVLSYHPLLLRAS